MNCLNENNRLSGCSVSSAPVILCILISCKEQNSDVIGVYDLRYTLSYDLNDTQQVGSLWDDIHAVATLQGIVNRKGPRLFIHYIVTHGIDIDSYWWDKYREPGRWLHEKDTVVYQDIIQLIEAYRKISMVSCYMIHPLHRPVTWLQLWRELKI